VTFVQSVAKFDYLLNQANQRLAVTNADNSRWDLGYDFLSQITNLTHQTGIDAARVHLGTSKGANRNLHQWMKNHPVTGVKSEPVSGFGPFLED
jgi:hypothetical protein